MITKKTIYTSQEAKIRGHQLVDEQAEILRTQLRSKAAVTASPYV